MRHLPEYEPDGDCPEIVPPGFKSSEKESPSSSTPLNVLPISVSLICFPDSVCANAVVEKARIVVATISAIRMDALLLSFRSLPVAYVRFAVGFPAAPDFERWRWRLLAGRAVGLLLGHERRDIIRPRTPPEAPRKKGPEPCVGWEPHA